MVTPRKPVAPGEGERRAQRGYVPQYDASAAAIYASLERDDLIWVGLADRQAGVADDLVLGLYDRIVGHQFKTSRYPEAFRVRTLLLGADGLLKPLAAAWRILTESFQDQRVEIRLATNNYPSNSDSLISGEDAHSAAFLQEFGLHPGRTLADWQSSRWWPFVDELVTQSGLDSGAFGVFFGQLRILFGPAADFLQGHRLFPSVSRQIGQIANLLPRLVADVRDRDRWTRAQFLEELGWRDSFALRRSHQFPVGAHVQRNVVTEQALRDAIKKADSGYIALVGPPGSGKSTLLQSSLSSESTLVVIRYLAFVPGEGQGTGRAEANDFLDDLNSQLKRSGLRGLRYRDGNLQERREQFERLLEQAGSRYQQGGVRTLIAVDGLDHVPREERPERSLLTELPLPSSVPTGVLLLLGTQRLDLADLKPAVRDQALLPQREVRVAPLSREAVYRIADVLGLDPEVPRQRIFEISQGHPLVTRYLIEALRGSDAARRQGLLAGEFTFAGDLETVYSSAWRDIEGDSDARDVMGYLARAEGPIQAELLARAASAEAVERALASTQHLLSRGPQGLSVFHNSFRLFLLRKPRLRFGEPALDYSSTVYRQLAQLACVAAAGSAQRWLELRYLARAQRDSEVLALAQPARFRHQLADARPGADIQADIRLSFNAARSAPNATTVFRLLLARDEIGRRTDTLGNAPAVVDALLATGDIDGALAFAEANRTGGYKVVDALVEVGEIDRARELFDRIEPISKMLGGHSDDFSDQDRELREWAERVFHFRDAEQINEAIERLSKSSLAARGGSATDTGASRAEYLRFTIARAAIALRPGSDPLAVAQQLKLDGAYVPYLLLEAAFGSRAQGDANRALNLLSEALAHAAFPKVQNSWRRAAAIMAAELGDTATARRIFLNLKVPAIATLDERIGEDVPGGVARAVMEHAELATLLGERVVEAPQSKRELLQPLQHHANTIGVLLGRTRAGGSIATGEVARVTHQLLAFLERASPRAPGEFYAMQQIAGAARVLAPALVRAAAMSGENEFVSVVEEFDRAFAAPDSKNGKRIDLRRGLARDVYRWDGNTAGACQRLEPLVRALREDTPQTQVEELGELAATFAHVGNETRAKELLHRIHNQSLGYALAPKKDPQYVFWRDLLKLANASDPAMRPERVEVMMRQLHGMTHTEGRSSAYRIAAAVLAEAALIDSANALAAARAIAEWGLLSWDGIVTAVLAGVVQRRNDLAGVCAVTWASLALPFYNEPHYRQDECGELIFSCISAAKHGELSTLVEILRGAIEAESRAPIRAKLLERLRDAAALRGVKSDRLDEALARWRTEAPVERDGSTPERYDDVTSLAGLEERLKEKAAPLSYEVASAYTRLIDGAHIEEAQEMFERWPDIRQDVRARFRLVELALAAGASELARRLTDEYLEQLDERATWSYWAGAGKLKYFRARLKLDGTIAHKDAYADFVGELAAGREYTWSLLADVEDVFSTITAVPDWPAMWECLAEQLKTTREYAVGGKFEVPVNLSSDEELIASIYRWALSLSVFEVAMHVRIGALRLISIDRGTTIFARLVRQLVEGQADEPAEALQLLVIDATDSVASDLGDTVSALVAHPDYAVAAAAAKLCERWGSTVPAVAADLPPFYRIQLDEGGEDFEPPSLVDPRTGAMLVEDPLGWTFAFPRVVRSLARKGPSIRHIRHRCWMLISGWGGLPAFGQSATERLESELARMEMRMTYFRPHAAVGARALRYVAGEMRSAGLLDAQDEPWLLEMMGYPAVRLPLLSPSERPRFLIQASPDQIGWRNEDEARWLDAVSNDVRPIAIGRDVILAEITRFRRRYIRRNFTLERMRAPFFDVDQGGGLSSWVGALPRAVWVEGVVPLSDEPAPTVVRHFSQGEITEVPRDMLVICPMWLRRLTWRAHPQNWLVYVDREGRVVVNTIWWRDGAPGDVQEDMLWAEGVLVIVTPEGRAQLEGLLGPLRVQVNASRGLVSEAESAGQTVRFATARE